MGKKKLRFAAAVLLLTLTALLAPAAWGDQPPAVTFKSLSRGPGGDYPLEDFVRDGTEPNVLFFMDVSANMTMSMKGQRPSTNYNLYPANRDGNLRQTMLEEDTFGMGGRPVSKGVLNNQSARLNDKAIPFSSPIFLGDEYATPDSPQGDVGYSYNYQRWGRDIDESNNIIGHPDHYYSLDPARPYLLTFKYKELAEWSGTGTPAKPGKMPQSDFNALMACVNSGTQVPSHLTKYLVPNDSKIYKLKLVLSRITAPTNSNMEMLSKIRLGVASTFYERSSSYLISAGMKNYPFRYRNLNLPTPSGSNTSTSVGGLYRIDRHRNESYYLHHNGSFEYLSIPDASGLAVNGSHTGANGVLDVYSFYYPFYPSAYVFGGVLGHTTVHYKRSILHIPFDFMYSSDTGGFTATDSLITFREMIDGVEQIDASSSTPMSNKFVNDEFFISSIPGSNEDLIYATSSWGSRPLNYATGAVGARGAWNNPNVSSSVIYRRMKTSEGLVTGTVVGNILDFFSPKSLGFDSSGGASDTSGYFPVTRSCQSNWVVYFTTGNEEKPGRSMDETGSMMHSLGQIYKESVRMNGRTWNGSQWVYQQNILMDNPIRTIVVGLVTRDGMEDDGNPYTADSTSDSQAKRARKAIRRMAHAGQPIATRDPDTGDVTSIRENRSIEPIFADNVPELIASLNDMLSSIRTEPFSGGAPRIQPVSDGNGVYMYLATFRVDQNKQWHGDFDRYVIPAGQENSFLDWRAGSQMVANAASRGVYAIDGSMDTGTAPMSTISAMAGSKKLSGRTATPQANELAFKDWLLGYKTSTVDSEGNTVVVDDNGILGDSEHSAPVFMPKGAPETIFIQTNRGVLHSFDYDTGAERWAFIPPPIFNERLWRQKFTAEDQSSRERSGWMAGNGSTTAVSQPLMLLDGQMSVNDDGAGKTYLMGALGLSGNGFYMMDVSDPSAASPNFLWSIDNDRYETRRDNSVHMMGASFMNQGTSGYDTYMKGYEDLGLTIVAPELRRTSNGLVGFVPGGLGWNMGKVPGDDQGKAFFVFKPDTGAIIKKITTSSGYTGPTGTKLGMGITPALFILEEGQESGGNTTNFFTGDSEGNILYCDTTQAPGDWTLDNLFTVRGMDGANLDKAIALPFGFDYITVGQTEKWLFGGTANIIGVGKEEVTGSGGQSAFVQKVITNPEQYIFALKVHNLLSYAGAGAKSMSDLTPFTRGVLAQTNTPGDYGWRMRLADADYSSTQPSEAEVLTAAPHLNPINGTLYVATFIANFQQSQQEAGVQCAESGYAKLYGLEYDTGKAEMLDGAQQALEFNNIKIVGIAPLMKDGQNRLFLGIRELGSNSIETEFGKHPGLHYNIHAGRTVVEIWIDGEEPREHTLQELVPHTQYFREKDF